MKTLKLVSPLPPSVNNYLNYKVATNGKRKFVQAYPSPETVVYENFFTDYVKDQIREQGWEKPEKGKQVFVNITFYFDRKRKDPNNFLKVLFDVLKEAGVYIDDDIAIPVGKRVYIDKANPRLEIEIVESGMIGIFDDAEDCNSFLENNCFQCKKDHTKCSILKMILDNRLVPEVKDRTCLRRKPLW